ncbi:MAG: tetratricopeptide repeat protein [Aquisalimonadaceae bacterium]
MGPILRSVLTISVLMLVLAGCASLPGERQDTRLTVLRLEAHAMHAYHGDRNEEALGLYREIVELDPEHVQARYRVGNLLAEQGDLEGAMQRYGEVLNRRPDHADARHNLALVHIRHGAALLEQARDDLADQDPRAIYQADRFLAYLLTGLVRSVDIAVDCED